MLGDVTPKKPRAYDLRETLGALTRAWKARRLDDLERRHMRRAPWVFFYPPDQKRSWIAKDQDFAEAYLKWSTENTRASSIASAIHVFLLYYPQDLDAFQTWRKGLLGLLRQVESVRLNRWKGRCKKYFFLESDGCARFAGAWLKSDKSAPELLTDAGLTHELATSAFLANVHDRLLRYTREYLEKNAMPLWQLDRVFALAAQKGKPRFPDRYRLLVDSLLLPFTTLSPTSEIQEKIQSFLLRCVGDLRIKPSRWQGVDPLAREVMLKWLVGATLEDFFRLLDHTALDRHWRYRKAFWLAYLERGHITDSWVLLGSQARRIAQTFLSDEASRYGYLSRGVQGNHSVLLLKVAGLTVSEWSHSGACRVWLSDNENRPRLYAKHYTRYDYPAKSRSRSKAIT